ncbi:MAG TPA: hypothetical protein VKG45_06315 [Actinomycetes bacterium]|nr:hypothetical protein [Actinomycetes bacterium]
MNAHDQVRPLLAARPGELDPVEARMLTEHVSRCAQCAAEAAGYTRLAAGLRALRELELIPPARLLDALLPLAPRRRPSARLVAAAAGSLGAVAATVAVAGVVRARRRAARARVVAVPAPPGGAGVLALIGRRRRRPGGPTVARPAFIRPALGRAAAARAR